MSTRSDSKGDWSVTNISRRLLDREREQEVLRNRISETGSTTVYLYGPRGSGKTTVTRRLAKDLASEIELSYISCIQSNTQYRVLESCYEELSGDPLGTGYHTSDLKHRIEEVTVHTPVLLILDEIDFLLHNDGSDLLYYLSRLDSAQELNLICISANYPDIATEIDNRTYSSLLPDQVTFEPYGKQETKRILSELSDESVDKALTTDALSYMAETTNNIRFGLYWLDLACNTAEEAVSKNVLEYVQLEAIHRYQDVMLNGFTIHHSILLEAISQLVSETGGVTQTGAVNERYEDLCEAIKEDSYTHRQISDYLKHLDLLGLINVDYHHGGSQGKTREIRLTQAF